MPTNQLEAAQKFANEAGPELDRMIDRMLIDRDAGQPDQPDPLNPGLFPSLGFANEKRGAYFLQVEQGDFIISVWRLLGATPTYNINTYRKHVHNGVVSWGGNVSDRVPCEDLVQVQAIIHHIITFGGNLHDQET